MVVVDNRTSGARPVTTSGALTLIDVAATTHNAGPPVVCPTVNEQSVSVSIVAATTSGAGVNPFGRHTEAIKPSPVPKHAFELSLSLTGESMPIVPGASEATETRPNR